MRRLSGVVLAGALLLVPAAFSLGDGKVHAQAAPPLTFDTDTAIMTVTIKPDKTADFEQIVSKVKEALMKSDKPNRKEQAAGWKLLKGTTAMKDGTIIYMHVISPVVKGADYGILPILYEVFTDPAEQRKLFEQYRDSFAANLGNGTYNTVLDLSKAP